VKIKFKDIKKKASKDLIIYGIGQGFNLLTPLLVTPYIINVCGIKNYGKVGVAMAFAFFVIVIIDYGIDIIGVKEVSTFRENKEKLQNIFSVSYSGRFILLVGICGLLSILFLLIPFFSSEKPLFFLIFFILIGQFINPNWFLQGIDNFVKISVLNIVSKIIYLVLVFIFVQAPEDYIYVNLFWGIGMILPFSYGVMYCIKKYNFRFILASKNQISNYLKDGYKFCISQVFLSFKNYSPIILISFLGGFNTAGFYRVIEQIIGVFRTYLQVTFRFFYPKICFLIYTNKKQGIDFWKKVNLANISFILLLTLFVFVLSEPILQFFKIQLNDIDEVSYLLRFALILPFLISISYSLEQLLFSLERKDFYIKITIPSVLLNFLMMYTFFCVFNLKGLISSLMITEITIILAYSIYLNFYFKENKTD